MTDPNQSPPRPDSGTASGPESGPKPGGCDIGSCTLKGCRNPLHRPLVGRRDPEKSLEGYRRAALQETAPWPPADDRTLEKFAAETAAPSCTGCGGADMQTLGRPGGMRLGFPWLACGVCGRGRKRVPSTPDEPKAL